MFMADGEHSRTPRAQICVRDDTEIQGRAVKIWKWF